MPRHKRTRKRGGVDEVHLSERAAEYGIKIETPTSGERYLSPNNIGKILGITGEAVKQWIYRRRLPAVKLSNGYWKIKVADFENFLKRRTDYRRNIMVVSDDKNLLSAPTEKYQLITVHNIADALLKIEDLQPAALLIDTECKHTDVWKLLEQVRESKQHKAIKVVVLSNANQIDCDKALALKVQAMLTRGPANISMNQIWEEIDRVLSRTV